MITRLKLVKFLVEEVDSHTVKPLCNAHRKTSIS